MKLCLVSLDSLPVLAPEYSNKGSGGEQVQHTLLAKALLARGFDVSMIVYDYGQPDGATWSGVRTVRAYAAKAGLPVVRFLYPRLTGLWSALARADADVYYVSCSGALLGQVSYFCRRHHRRVVFRVAHDLDCAADTPLVRNWRDKRIYRYGLRRADSILVQGARQQAELQRNFGRQSVVARMLVDAPAQIVPFENRSIDVLWVNNMNRLKRPDLFLRLVEQQQSLISHMIGGPQPGHEALYDGVAASARNLNSLTFHGPVPYREINDFYARARVFVNTSDSEGFPNSYLQAWIRGTPVIAYFDPDGIINREGLGAAVSSESEMRATVERLATDEAAWQECSSRCRTFMARHYGDDEVLQPYLSVISAARST